MSKGENMEEKRMICREQFWNCVKDVEEKAQGHDNLVCEGTEDLTRAAEWLTLFCC